MRGKEGTTAGNAAAPKAQEATCGGWRGGAGWWAEWGEHVLWWRWRVEQVVTGGGRNEPPAVQ